MVAHRIINGDCRAELKLLADCSVDSIVTDPPYELGFMGKGWDRSGIAYDVTVWRECLRVLKPGGHLLAFGGSRTYHRLACAIEDAGFEIRDQIQWIYGSGFPKSLDVSKAIDATAGAEREAIGSKYVTRDLTRNGRKGDEAISPVPVVGVTLQITVPATDAAKQWDGWGTALKPAHEPIVLARKPLVGTVAANVLEYRTGGLNIARCRIETNTDDALRMERCNTPGSGRFGNETRGIIYGGGNGTTSPNTRLDTSQGRWPSNVIHDGSEEVLAGFPETTSGDKQQGTPYNHTNCKTMGAATGAVTRDYPGDSGSAARFFYCAKASKEDREEGLNALPLRSAGDVTDRKDGSDGLNSPRAGAGRTNGSRNHHPTVKPTDLMRYLCRLVTPPNGVVLDPFCGSGSTGKAAVLEGLNFIGIELNAEYCDLAEKRIAAATVQGSLFTSLELSLPTPTVEQIGQASLLEEVLG